MSDLPKCPECGSELTYDDGAMLNCPECGHEWPRGASNQADDDLAVRDCNGNVLKDGDTVTVIKDLKVKGTSGAIKMGAKVRNIRIAEGDHNIDCKVEGVGQIALKSKYVKKV